VDAHSRYNSFVDLHVSGLIKLFQRPSD